MIPNVLFATEDPTFPVGNIGDIYFCTGFDNEIRVFKRFASGWRQIGGISDGSGQSFLSSNIARVDPSGNDSTGKVGDLSNPFLTLQAALTALEAQGGFTSNFPAIVLLPIMDTSDDVTTSLEYLVLQGWGEFSQSAPAIGIITFTATTNVIFGANNLWINGVLAPNLTGDLELHLHSVIINGDITATGANAILLKSEYNTAEVSGTITTGTGKSLFLRGIAARPDGDFFCTINAPDTEVIAYNSLISTVTAAGSITLHDSRIVTNNSGVTPTISDILLNPALMDFSTLPTSEPTEVGKAWIDTTGDLNVIKVKL